ncbi:hypothetical protein PGTUg99_012220 [Puccinia graminis f. sp. tritici]|uniref:Uncharacterized protein n=1 Tax=Puccinia graminis f. sp. tritici TaxID=56615 RepID=A0A5B0QSE3_PUCGR|nr:hypothetical protein PGTUg99_012220 [Puccinia graminis f. sp. tritici]
MLFTGAFMFTLLVLVVDAKTKLKAGEFSCPAGADAKCDGTNGPNAAITVDPKKRIYKCSDTVNYSGSCCTASNVSHSGNDFDQHLM